MKTGLVLEGGAMRGMFTAGVLDVLMEHNIQLDGAIGVSAGAVFGCNYKSHQIGRTIRYNTEYCTDKRYASFGNLLRTGNLYSEQFCYHTVPEKLDPFDTKAFRENPMDFFVVCTDVRTGEPIYHKCRTGDAEDIRWMQASASMPLAAKIVKIGHCQLLDGGVADSIPVRFFESIGYKRNLIILTQPKGFVKRKTRCCPLSGQGMCAIPLLWRPWQTGTSATMRHWPIFPCWSSPAGPSSSARPSRWRFPLWSATPPSCAAFTRPAVPWHRSRSTRSQPMWRSARLHQRNNTKGCCTGLCGSLF